MRFLSLRACFLVAFVVAMPLLALPPVARRIDEWMYGPPPTDFGRPPVAAPREEPAEPAASPVVAPALFVEPPGGGLGGAVSPAAHLSPPVTPAPRASLPADAPFDPPRPPQNEQPVIVNQQTLARLQQLRQRLEQLGAEYVVVETLQSTGRYRFHCRMLIDERSRFTRSFEVNAADPVAAGEQVLREVEAWRSGGAAPPAR
jgi:hypothetical protein